jgi:hypothetical protein
MIPNIPRKEKIIIHNYYCRTLFVALDWRRNSDVVKVLKFSVAVLIFKLLSVTNLERRLVWKSKAGFLC